MVTVSPASWELKLAAGHHWWFDEGAMRKEARTCSHLSYSPTGHPLIGPLVDDGAATCGPAGAPVLIASLVPFPGVLGPATCLLVVHPAT